MSDTRESVFRVITVGDEGNAFTLVISARGLEDDWADATVAPWLDLQVLYRGEDVVVELPAIDLGEEKTKELIGALTAALDAEREAARARGFYRWVADGRPWPAIPLDLGCCGNTEDPS